MSDVFDYSDEMPVLSEVMSMTLDSLERSGLDARTYLRVRLAALAAMGATPASWLLNLSAAADAGLEVEDVQAVLVGIAPVIGSARTVSAATNAVKALGLAVAAELDGGEG